METHAVCPRCRKVQQVRVNGCFPVLVTHLDIGVYCYGSATLVTTDADVLALVAGGK